MKNKLEVNGTAKVTGSHQGVLPILVMGAMIIGETNITTELNGDVQIW